MYITFYINKADSNVVNKSSQLTKVVKLNNVQIPDAFNVRDFVLIMSKNDYDITANRANYVCLNHLFRYYFVMNVAYDGDFAKLHLKCDVLYTFKDYILNNASGGYITSAKRRPQHEAYQRKSGETFFYDDSEITRIPTECFEGDYKEFTTENPTTVLTALKGKGNNNI